MKILGIDTTSKFLSLGIYDNSKLYECNLETGRRLSSLITLTIKRILDALGWEPRDIDFFACGLGPGSFTGMRIGIATIKGLAFSLNKPVIGIPSLDILARNIKPTDNYLIPVIDAKRGLIYCSVYKIKENRLKRIAPYMLLNEKEFLKKLRNNSVIFGDAVSLYKQKILRHIRDITILDKDYWYPQGHNIITLALEKIEDAECCKSSSFSSASRRDASLKRYIRDKKLSNPFEIRPIYLYPKECQICK